MTTPKEALEAARKCIWSGGDSLATVAIIDEALASLQGEDAVERVALPPIPDDDADFTPDLARKIIAKYQAILATGLVPDEAVIRAEPTEAQINSACLSYRHDYGLLPPDLRARTRFKALEWLRAWQKEGFGADRDEIIERCAAVVDQCNREGPYQAIGAATKIRALKTDPTIAPDEAAIRAAAFEQAASVADCLADEYDATSFTSTNAEQVAALRSKEQAAHEIAAAIRGGRLAAERALTEAVEVIKRDIAALDEADAQIEYLHKKFKPTGSGARALAKIDIAATAARAFVQQHEGKK